MVRPYSLDYAPYKNNVTVEDYDNTPKQTAGRNSKSRNTFENSRLTFAEEQMKKETERCIGCGQCTINCKFDAITHKKVDNMFGTEIEKLPLRIAPYAVKRAGRIVEKTVREGTEKLG